MKTSSKIVALGIGCIACCAIPVALSWLAVAGIAALVADSLKWAGVVGVLSVAAFLLWRLMRPGASATSCGCGSDPVAPIACTLSGDDFKARTAWIRDLAQTSLVTAERDDLVLRLTYDVSATLRVREMVEKERACCAFMRFDVREDGRGIHVTMTAPESARAAADDLFGHFAPETARRAAQSSFNEKETVS